MKLMKRANIYQCSSYNCTFDPKTMDAFSYRWWRFVAVIDGLIVFNNCRYSNSTSKHQSKVRHLMNTLGIKIDLEMPLPRGIRHDQNLGELILSAEEYLCEAVLNEELKREDRNTKARIRRLKNRLENYLENSVHFRDYDIEDRKSFGKINKIAVHQCVDAETLEHDVENALRSFGRDGFGSVVFYIGDQK